MKTTLLAVVVALALVPVTQAGTTRSAAPTLPAHGVLTPGKSLAGIHLGDTIATVKATWGSNYQLCAYCKGTVYFYIYTRGEPLGAGVRFDKSGKVVAVFTLGAPSGWRTAEGLQMGEQIDKVTQLYGQVGWKRCIGYGAMSMRAGNAVTSIYTTGTAVYGFAITAPAEPVCQ